MGYDYFALLVVPENLYDDNRLDIVENICQELPDQDHNILFGEVHHLSSDGFTEYWWHSFDRFVKNFYLRTEITKVYIYVCEYDGKFLFRHEYINGIRTDHVYEAKMIITDPAVRSYWNINSLEIKGNITIWYNPNYNYEYDY